MKKETTEEVKTISDEELKQIKKEASEILANVRQQVLMTYPFIGSISMRLELIPTRDYRVRTACTNGSEIYFDIEFLSKLDSNERLFVLCHEIYHVVMMHMLRLQNRNVELFNIATDMEVNYMLKQDGLTAPSNLVFPDSKYEGESAEEHYERLLKQMKNQMKNGGSNSGINKDGMNNGSSGDGTGKSKNGKLSGQFDKHIYDSNDEDDDNKGSGNNADGRPTDKYGVVGEDPDYNPSFKPNLADEIREAVVSAAQECEKMRGELPGHLSRIVKKLLKPEIKWQEVLARYITTSVKSGQHRWIPPARRHVYRGLYLPSKYEERMNVTVGIDVSGSTEGDLPKFFAELTGLLNTFGSYKLNVIQCDTQVCSYEEYDSSENQFNFNISDYKFSGGGGTTLTPILEYIDDNQVESDVIVIFTDGYCENVTYNPSKPVLWIITSTGTEEFQAPGQKVKMKKND